MLAPRWSTCSWRPLAFQPTMPAAHEVGEGLLDEERVAAGAREDRGADRLGLLGVLEATQDQFAAGLLVELAQLDRVHAGDRARGLGARSGPGGAQAEQRQAVRVVEPLEQEGVAVLVDEVEVVEDDQHRPALSERADQAADELPQLIAALERVELAGVGDPARIERGGQAGCQRGGAGDAVALQLRLELVRGGPTRRGEEVAQELEEDAERGRCAGATGRCRGARSRRCAGGWRRSDRRACVCRGQPRRRPAGARELRGADRLGEAVAQGLLLELAAQQRAAPGRRGACAPRRRRGRAAGRRALGLRLSRRTCLYGQPRGQSRGPSRGCLRARCLARARGGRRGRRGGARGRSRRQGRRASRGAGVRRGHR
jgi:hypothetical protein